MTSDRHRAIRAALVDVGVAIDVADAYAGRIVHDTTPAPDMNQIIRNAAGHPPAPTEGTSTP